MFESDNQVDICLVVAFTHEAKPIVDSWSLKRDPYVREYPLYTGEKDGHSLALVISGVGCLQVSQAISWLFGSRIVNKHTAWLNIGIAGHSSWEIGHIFTVNKCVYSVDGSSWYPSRIIRSSLDSSNIYCVANPESDYREHGAYDMETAGFFSAISKFGTMELAHAIKVVSDNPDSDWQQLDKTKIKTLIESALNSIDKFLVSLLAIAIDEKEINRPPKNYAQILDQAHFTQTQKHQLYKLLIRWEARFEEISVLEELGDVSNSTLWLKQLEESLNVPMALKS